MGMRRIVAFALIGCAASTAHGVEFWHSNTVWGGQGMCSATFTFNSGFVEIDDLAIVVALVDGAGNEVVADTLNVAPFGGSGVDRYASASLDGAGLCDDALTVVVKSASANVDGKPTDLIATQALSARVFKPFAIRIPQGVSD